MTGWLVAPCHSGLHRSAFQAAAASAAPAPPVDVRPAVTGAPSLELCSPLPFGFVLQSPLGHGWLGPSACATLRQE